MELFRSLFGGNGSSGEPAMQRPFTIRLDPEEPSRAVYVSQDEDPRRVIDLLKIGKTPRAAIFITGGAAEMTEQDKKHTRQIFEEGIAPFANKHQIAVLDGGTQYGVIEMMARARQKANHTFPLIGIAPYKVVDYPGKRPRGGDILCPGHSHFVLVSGDDYGAESEMMVYLTHTLAGGVKKEAARKFPAVGIVINGGKITRQEAYLASTKALAMPLIVLEGSGRFADELATAKRTGQTSQALLRSIISRADIEIVSTASGPNGMIDKLEAAVAAQK